MVMPKDYQLVEDFRAKISGNVESKVLTPEQCSAEIEKSSEGVFSEQPESLGPFERKCPDCGVIIPRGTGHTHGYVTKSGRYYKSKPGRRPKPPKEAK